MSSLSTGNFPWQRRAMCAFAMLAFGVAVVSVHGQDTSSYPPGAAPSRSDVVGDAPGRVARLFEATGQVWLSSLDSPEWIAVDRNQPLTSGDRLAVDRGGRAELAVGSTTLRLDGGTELEVSLLDDTRFVVQLLTGSVAARLRHPQAVAEFELDTGEGRFRALQVGRYRFDRSERSSDVTVYGGQAVFEGRGSALPVSPGQHVEFWLDAAGAAQYNMVAPERDPFAAWNDERDLVEDRFAATPNRFVSPEMTGAQDLQRYGTWQQDVEYGSLWIPRDVASDWAPYSTGHWAWVRPWGWTWVDDAAWGFAPFHYGRWINRRNQWCWTPGTYAARPIYAPALVAWVGGPRANLSITIGGGRNNAPVGWFPLGPREVFVPGYRHSQRYVRNINLVHVNNAVNITNITENRGGAADRRTFVNRESPHAMTVVQANVLVNREAVRGSASRYGDSLAMRALKDERISPVLTVAPVATPPRARNGNEGVRERPPGFAESPRAARADRGGDPPSDRRVDRGGSARLQPGVLAGPPGQPDGPSQWLQPNPHRGAARSFTASPDAQPLPPLQPVHPGQVAAPNLNAPRGAVRDRGETGRDGEPPRERERFGDRAPGSTHSRAMLSGPPPLAPVAAPSPTGPAMARPNLPSQFAPPAGPAAFPPPRERFQRPATPSERTPPPGPVGPSMAPAPSHVLDNARRPVPQAIDDARAVQRAERGERRERGEPGQAPSMPRAPEAMRPAPAVDAAPPPVMRTAPAARPAEARPAEATRAEPTAREDRREPREHPR